MGAIIALLSALGYFKNKAQFGLIPLLLSNYPVTLCEIALFNLPLKKISPFTLLRPVICLTSSLIFLSACSTKPVINTTDSVKHETQTSHPSVAHLTTDQKSQLYFEILLADIAEQKNLTEVAQNNYAVAAEQTSSTFLFAKASQAALRGKDFLGAYENANLWFQQHPQDITALKTLILSALLVREAKPSENSYQQFPSINQQTLKSWLSVLLKKLKLKYPNQLDEQSKNLLQILHYKDLTRDSTYLLTGLEKIQPALVLFLQASSQFKILAKQPSANFTNALQQVDASLDLQPNFLMAIRLKLAILESQNPQAVTDYLLQLVADNSLSNSNLKALGQELFQKKRYALSAQLFQQLLEQLVEQQSDISQAIALQTKFQLASAHYGANDYEQSLEFFKQLADADYNKSISSYYCADAALRIEEQYAAIECFLMVPIGQHFFSARSQLADLYADNDQLKAAISSLRQAQGMVGFKQRMRLLKFEVAFLSKHLKHQQAYERAKQLIELEPSNPLSYYLTLKNLSPLVSLQELLTQVKALQNNAKQASIRNEITYVTVEILQVKQNYLAAYQLLKSESNAQPNDMELLFAKAIAAEPLGYYQQMISDLRSVLSNQPLNYDAMNTLGYTLADLNQSLEEAKQLIQRAYSNSPDDSAIIDSMGWIEFRLGNLNSARNFLEIAYGSDKNPEIAAHLGEVYWNLGHPQKARAIWDEALKREPNNRYLLSTLKRFEQT